MRPSRIVASIVAVVLLGGAAAAFAVVWRPAIAAVEPPGPLAFDAALVKRGRELAAIGNCNNCHTVSGGRNFAGGLPVPTPFGTIFSSNITPDAETGIGRWSEAAFRRAMRSGVNREGQHLYPTFPYDHFTHVSDEDDRALYAFLMTRQPVRAPARENQLVLPVQPAVRRCRVEIAVPSSRHLSARSQAKAPNGTAVPIWSKAWRIAAPATRHAMRWAPNATTRNLPAAMSTTGTPTRSTTSPTRRCRGMPMPCSPICATAGTPTTVRRAGRWRKWSAICPRSPSSDVRAIAVYMAGISGTHRRWIANVRARPRWNKPRRLTRHLPLPNANTAGASIYAAACASCHAGGRPLPYGGINLALSTAIASPDPRNLANIVLSGVPARHGRKQPDHARICRQHDRCAGVGLAEAICGRGSATSRHGPALKRPFRTHAARRPHLS